RRGRSRRCCGSAGRDRALPDRGERRLPRDRSLSAPSALGHLPERPVARVVTPYGEVAVSEIGPGQRGGGATRAVVARLRQGGVRRRNVVGVAQSYAEVLDRTNSGSG